MAREEPRERDRALGPHDKKASGTPSVTWDDCVVACLTWGWIDGLVRGLDDVSYIQRMTPRRPKSLWSTRSVATLGGEPTKTRTTRRTKVK